MAMMLFTLLNVLGVVFLLYVLVQSWKEARRPIRPALEDKVIDLPVRDRPTVLVVTRPISSNTHSGFSVISAQTRISSLQERELDQDAANGAGEMPLNRFFAR